MVSLDLRVAASPDVMVSDVGNESVLLHLKSERYFGLDDVGTQMWKTVTSSESVGTAFQKLLVHYQVDPATLERDLVQWVGKMIEQGLLERLDG